MLVVGAFLLTYPTFADWWNSFHATRVISNYVQQIENMDTEEFEQIRAEAVAYNERLLHETNRYIQSDEQLAEYNSLLDVTGNGVMGYIDIPKIRVTLPIYHTTEESVLQVAIGHIPGTSLPVGGESTQCLLTGHRGLPSAKLFTDLDQLAEGDTFVLYVLDEMFTYQVDQIRIITPDDLSALTVEPDKDLCTLVTCTPYGVNSHRLLVRGQRIDNIIVSNVKVTADAMQIEPMIVAPVVAIPILLFLLMMIVVKDVRMKLRGRKIRKLQK
jgi:sortase A